MSLLLAMLCCSAGAQHSPYEYYLNGGNPTSSSYETPLGDSDLSLFFTPLAGEEGVFLRLSEFNFAAARYQRRGLARTLDRNYFANLELTEELTSRPNWSSLSAIRSTRFSRSRSSGGELSLDRAGLAGTTQSYSPSLALMPMAHNATFFGANRHGRGGARASSVGRLGKEWRYVVSLGGRWGRDGAIDALFSDQFHFVVGAEWSINSLSSLSFFVMGEGSERSLRSATTKEAFELTDNRLYNPSWGYWRGKRRSSRVVRRLQPISVVNYSREMSKSTTLQATLSYRFGRAYTSGLAWFDADTPYPDHYRKMPSYADSPASQQMATELWESGASEVTQLNWEQMWEANSYSGDSGARYLLEDRVESVNDLQIALSGESVIDKSLRLSYGVRLRRESTHLYKEVKDLLGGGAILDLDQYLIDDMAFGDKTLNDLRNPNRMVGEGDRFGYNYSMVGSRGELYGTVGYNRGRFRLSAGLELGTTSYQREGHYDKELYSEQKLSFGRSKRLSFEHYSAKVALGYSISPRHILSLRALTATLPPLYATLFVSPLYTNSVVKRSRSVGVNSVEGEYLMTLPKVRIRATGYYTTTRSERAIYSYFDDVESTFSRMLLSGISKEYYGAELSFEYDISPRFRFSTIGAIGQQRYSTNPSVEILDDATLKSYVVGAKSYMKGYRVGGSPQAVVSAELRFNARGWLVTATFSHMNQRYITPNPLRRMERSYPSQSTEPERFLAFVGQEKLSPISTVDIFVLKSFMIGKLRLTALASVNNLLGERNNIESGYEQMRILKRGYGATVQRTPSPSKYLYGTGRSYYISLIFKL